MGMDPLTIGLITSGIGAGVSAIGDARAQGARNRQQALVNSRANSMFQSGPSYWETNLADFMRGQSDPFQLDTNAGNIDVQSILASINPGNDALNQFLRSDPSRQLGLAAGGSFDSSEAFKMLQANDQMQVDRAANQLRAGAGSLGQRFGGAMNRNEGLMRGDFAAQIGARNAGIAQNSFESAAQRALQAATAGMGFELQGAQALANSGLSAAQIAAGLAQSNQNNLFRNSQFNADQLAQAFAQRMQGINMGFGMNQAGQQNNMNLLAIMAGLQPGGNNWQSAGGAMGDIGQLLAFLPMLRGMGGGGNTGGGKY